MSKRLILLCHAPTPSMREGGFPAADEAIDEGGLHKLAKIRLPSPRPAIVLTSPMVAARQTAEALELAAKVEPELRDLNHGDWTGRSLADIHASDPDALARWIADAGLGAPGGETMDALISRIGHWLDNIPKDVLAITHPMVIRAAIGAALDLPQQALFRIDISPLSIVTLSFNRIWRLQSLGAL